MSASNCLRERARPGLARGRAWRFLLAASLPSTQSRERAEAKRGAARVPSLARLWAGSSVHPRAEAALGGEAGGMAKKVGELVSVRCEGEWSGGRPRSGDRLWPGERIRLSGRRGSPSAVRGPQCPSSEGVCRGSLGSSGYTERVRTSAGPTSATGWEGRKVSFGAPVRRRGLARARGPGENGTEAALQSGLAEGQTRRA